MTPEAQALDPAVLDAVLASIRIVFGVTLAMHGCQKLFGWFGGGGLLATASWFSSLGFASGRVAAVLAGGTEVVGGTGIAFGVVTPLAAAAVLGVMTTAAIVNGRSGGFWSVSKGWELNLHMMLIAGLFAFAGPGRWSLDQALNWRVGGWAHGSAAVVVGVLAGGWTWLARARLGRAAGSTERRDEVVL